MCSFLRQYQRTMGHKVHEDRLRWLPSMCNSSHVETATSHSISATSQAISATPQSATSRCASATRRGNSGYHRMLHLPQGRNWRPELVLGLQRWAVH